MPTLIEWIVWHDDSDSPQYPPRELGRLHAETKRQAIAKATQRYVAPFWVQSVASHRVGGRTADLYDRYGNSMKYWAKRKSLDD